MDKYEFIGNNNKPDLTNKSLVHSASLYPISAAINF